MSLSSIHILYNHTPTVLLKAYTEPWCGLIIFHWTEVVLYVLQGVSETLIIPYAAMPDLYAGCADQHTIQAALCWPGGPGPPGEAKT